ncbi:MAG: hypothetical protein ACJAZ0_003278 [Halioglobus sp.]
MLVAAAHCTRNRAFVEPRDATDALVYVTGDFCECRKNLMTPTQAR